METKIYKSSKYQIVKSDIDGKMILTILATNTRYSVIEEGGGYQVKLGYFNSKNFSGTGYQVKLDYFNSKNFSGTMHLWHKIELNDKSIDNALSLISNK